MTAIIKGSAVCRFVNILYNSYLNSSLLKISNVYDKSSTKGFIKWFVKVLSNSLLYKLLYPFVDISRSCSSKSFLYRIFTYPFMIIIKLLQMWPGRLISSAIDNSSSLNALKSNKKHLALNAAFYIGLGIFVLFGVFTCLYYAFNRAIDNSLYIYVSLTILGLLMVLASTTNISTVIKNSLIYRLTWGFFQVFWKE
jgi:hypothetical protein